MHLRAAAILVTLALPLATDARPNSKDDFVAHGTINIVLANQNGLVVLTDSMITAGDRHFSPGQKLFRLDDRTVCTIASFFSAPAPIPDLNTSTSAIIREYSRKSAAQSPQSMADKARSLAMLFELHLSGIANMRDAVGHSSIHDYAFELIVAGYDIDGIPKIVKITLGTHGEKGLFSPNSTLLSDIQDFAILNVDKQLVWKLGGEPDVAERLLQNPGTLNGDADLSAYATSLHENGGQSLTLQQMTQLVKRLAFYTAKRYPSVGGANQIAVLQGGRIVKIEQQAFPEPPKALHYALLVNNEYSGEVGMTLPGPILFVRCNWTAMRSVALDGGYFIGNIFTRSVLTYDGGGGNLGSANQVDNSVLIIGPHAKQNDATVRHLVNDFHWLRVLHQDLPNQP
jgi:hypothetical protein